MNKKIFLIALVLFQFGRVGEANYVPVARIQSPENGSKFKVGEKITFKGKATDLEDGELSGGTFVWTSDMDGLIGQGSSFSTKLSEGSHIVILTATDLEGSSGRDSVFITVGTPKITEPVGEVKKPGPEKSKLEPEIEEIKVEKQTVPSIVFLFVPPFGSFEDLRGRVFNADPNEFAVAVYIMVDGLWWSKPVTKINKDGKWTCDITTTENDELAIKIAAYLIPIDYQPPLASGEFWILKEIGKKSIAKIEVTRKITTPSEVLKLKKNSEAKKPQPKEGPEEKPLIKEKEDMKRYFPLTVGNEWKYRKTVHNSDQIFHWAEATVTESDSWSNTFPKGTILFTIGRSVAEMASSSEERYTITSLASTEKEIYWNVKIEGDVPRDGRYEFGDPNVKWSYADNRIWEIIDGDYFGGKARRKSCLALLSPMIVITSKSEKEGAPLWGIGAILTQEVITTSAGRFSNCLKNCTLIKGKNLEDILLKNASPEFSDDEGPSLYSANEGFGKFLTVSFYAKDVGLVREAQYNYRREKTYELELIKYNVK